MTIYDEEYEMAYDYGDYECLFGSDCLAPGYNHMSDECFTAEMMEEQNKYYEMLEREEKFPILKKIRDLKNWILRFFKNPLSPITPDPDRDIPF
jgi:hypothetical protein